VELVGHKKKSELDGQISLAIAMKTQKGSFETFTVFLSSVKKLFIYIYTLQKKKKNA
jgi:hypothetical protein